MPGSVVLERIVAEIDRRGPIPFVEAVELALCDLTEAAERLASFLTDAASAPPTIVSLAAARAVRSGSERLQKTPKGGEHGQNTDNRGTSAVAPAGSTAVSS